MRLIARLLAAFARLLDARVDARPLAIMRIVAGYEALVYLHLFWPILANLITPQIVDLPGQLGLPYPTPAGLAWLAAVGSVAAVAFMVGWHTRLAGCVVVAVIGYILFLDKQTWSSNLYILFLLLVLVTLADAGARWSIDAWRGKGRATIPAWPVVLLKLQLTIVYGFAALAKLNVVYLSGALIWGATAGRLSLLVGPHPPVRLLILLAGISVLMEVFLALAFWSPRLRWPAVAVGIGLHGFIVFGMPAGWPWLGLFALSMFALYVPFLCEPLPRWAARPAVAPHTEENRFAIYSRSGRYLD